MKKNMFMRLAMALVLLVLVTTSAVGGTYAKYVTETTNEELQIGDLKQLILK